MSETVQKNVLLVVYDPLLGKSINRFFPRQEFKVEIAGSLEEAREKLNGVLFDAVITDWTRVNGEEVVKTAQGKVKNIIVINGGLVPQKKLVEYKKSGVEVVPKPFSPEALIKTIRGEVSEV